VAADERHRVGRRRRLGSNAPPVWFGIPFAAGGLLTLVLGLTTGVEQGVPLVVTSAIGLLFSVVGVALIWTSLRARTAEAPKTRTNLGPDDVERFTRSPMRIFVDLVGAPIGGLAFLGVAIAILFTPAFLGSIVFGFFGILMLTGAAVTVRRGIGMTVATVGPGGIWTPELGQLPWTEIAELRIEDPTGIGGPNNGTTTTYRRLGIVPRTQELIENAPGRDAMSLARGFMSFVNTLKPGTGLSDPTALAPYGIQAYETEQPFADIIRSVQRFAPVAGAEVALGDGTRLVDGDGAAALVANPPRCRPHRVCSKPWRSPRRRFPRPAYWRARRSSPSNWRPSRPPNPERSSVRGDQSGRAQSSATSGCRCRGLCCLGSSS
jgi:hypothetical protein